MNSQSSKSIYNDDFIELVNIFDFNSLKNKSICITGATGMIGFCLLNFLDFLNTYNRYNIKITVVTRSSEMLVKDYGDRIKVITASIEEFNSAVDNDVAYDYIFHAASPARPDAYINDPVGTMRAIIDGTCSVLEYCRKNSTTKMVYISTVEVVGSRKGGEDEALGILDISQVRSSYPGAKRAAEMYCHSYVEQFGCRVVIARPAKIYGLYNHKNDNRIIAIMQRNLEMGKNIKLNSRSGDRFSLCYVVDAVCALIFMALHGGLDGETYTIANPDSYISIPEFAEKLTQKTSIDVEYEEDKVDSRRFSKNANNLRFRSSKLLSLGWRPLTSIDQGINKILRHSV